MYRKGSQGDSPNYSLCEVKIQQLDIPQVHLYGNLLSQDPTLLEPCYFSLSHSFSLSVIVCFLLPSLFGLILSNLEQFEYYHPSVSSVREW